MDLAGEEGAGGQHHRRRIEAQAGLGDGAAHVLFSMTRSSTAAWKMVRLGLCFDDAADRAAVQRAIGLATRGAHRRTLGGIERAPLDAGQVGRVGHDPAQRIDFLDQVALADAADGRVAAHRADGFHVVGQQQGAGAGARGRQRGLGAGMAAADDDDVVVVEGSVHGFILASPRPAGLIEGAGAGKIGTVSALTLIAPVVASDQGRRLVIGTGASRVHCGGAPGPVVGGLPAPFLFAPDGVARKKPGIAGLFC